MSTEAEIEQQKRVNTFAHHPSAQWTLQRYSEIRGAALIVTAIVLAAPCIYRPAVYLHRNRRHLRYNRRLLFFAMSNAFRIVMSTVFTIREPVLRRPTRIAAGSTRTEEVRSMEPYVPRS